MFESTFRQILEFSLTDKSYNKKDVHGNYFGIGRQEGKPDHRRQQGIGPSIGAKNQQLVPDHWKTDPTDHPKVEAIRNKPPSVNKQKLYSPLNELELQKICDTYGIKNLSPEESKELGTTGVILAYNNRFNKYCLYK